MLSQSGQSSNPGELMKARGRRPPARFSAALSCRRPKIIAPSQAVTAPPPPRARGGHCCCCTNLVLQYLCCRQGYKASGASSSDSPSRSLPALPQLHASSLQWPPRPPFPLAWPPPSSAAAGFLTPVFKIEVFNALQTQIRPSQ